MTATHLRDLLFLALASSLIGTACDRGLSGEEAEKELTASILLPNEGPPLDNPATDDTINITSSGSGSGSGGTVKASGGDRLNVAVPFNAPNGNVVAAGIRFGSSGPIRTIPISGASGTQSGTLSFNAQLPRDVCDKLSKICHDIKCYEFAVTSAGRVSRGNITSMAVLCGDCNEPSCKGLVDQSACSTPAPVGQTHCSDASRCPNGSTLRSCASASPTGTTTCWYEVGGRKVSCNSCSGAALQTCAQQAVNLCSG